MMRLEIPRVFARRCWPPQLYDAGVHLPSHSHARALPQAIPPAVGVATSSSSSQAHPLSTVDNVMTAAVGYCPQPRASDAPTPPPMLLYQGRYCSSSASSSFTSQRCGICGFAAPTADALIYHIMTCAVDSAATTSSAMLRDELTMTTQPAGQGDAPISAATATAASPAANTTTRRRMTTIGPKTSPIIEVAPNRPAPTAKTPTPVKTKSGSKTTTKTVAVPAGAAPSTEVDASESPHDFSKPNQPEQPQPQSPVQSASPSPLSSAPRHPHPHAVPMPAGPVVPPSVVSSDPLASYGIFTISIAFDKRTGAPVGSTIQRDDVRHWLVPKTLGYRHLNDSGGMRVERGGGDDELEGGRNRGRANARHPGRSDDDDLEQWEDYSDGDDTNNTATTASNNNNTDRTSSSSSPRGLNYASEAVLLGGKKARAIEVAVQAAQDVFALSAAMHMLSSSSEASLGSASTSSAINTSGGGGGGDGDGDGGGGGADANISNKTVHKNTSAAVAASSSAEAATSPRRKGGRPPKKPRT